MTLKRGRLNTTQELMMVRFHKTEIAGKKGTPLLAKLEFLIFTKKIKRKQGTVCATKTTQLGRNTRGQFLWESSLVVLI